MVSTAENGGGSHNTACLKRETGLSPTINVMHPPPLGGMSRKHINRSLLDVERVSERETVFRTNREERGQSDRVQLSP